ncbi:MAG: hypothetical protein WKG00_18225 [Polyangiaceae bacterium]
MSNKYGPKFTPEAIVRAQHLASTGLGRRKIAAHLADELGVFVSGESVGQLLRRLPCAEQSRVPAPGVPQDAPAKAEPARDDEAILDGLVATWRALAGQPLPVSDLQRASAELRAAMQDRRRLRGAQAIADDGEDERAAHRVRAKLAAMVEHTRAERLRQVEVAEMRMRAAGAGAFVNTEAELEAREVSVLAFLRVVGGTK